MTAYMIAQVDVKDAEKFEAYRALVPDSLKPFGGEYIVRGGEMVVLEDQQPFDRVVVIKFPDLESAKAWHASEEYAEAKAMRQAAATSRLILVDGYDG